MTPREEAQREQALLAELVALYREVDALHEGARCDVSTECCRFGITGREPQVTSLELALVQRALRARGGPLKAEKRALPIAGNREGTCPLLDRQGRCAVYASRPLGCRTFFCSRAVQLREPSRDEQRDWVRRLQALAARHVREGDRPRALRRALG